MRLVAGSMAVRGSRRTAFSTAPVRGISLVELLAAMAIFSMLLLMLAQALDLSLNQWLRGSGGSAGRGELRAALSWMKRDLQAAVVDRSANVASLPADSSEVETEFFADRLILPIEINRREGTGGIGRSFVNSAAEFDSLAFVTRTPLSAQTNPARDRERLGLAGASTVERASSWDGLASACLTGYYVAWTKNSPLASERESSMKLFRHFRPGGPSLGQGTARGFLRTVSHEINDDEDELSASSARAAGVLSPALVRNGIFGNADVPFLFAARFPKAGTTEEMAADQPWPADAAIDSLASPPAQYQPPQATWSDWADPENVVHDYLFADEPLAYNVVRFECRPYRRIVDADGNVRVFDSAQLNQHLGLSGSDWPALVAPDFIEVTIAVVSRVTASKMQQRQDWIIDWSRSDPSSWSTVRGWVERDLKTFTTRIFLHPAP